MQHRTIETGFLRLPQIVGQQEITAEQARKNKEAGRQHTRPRPHIPAIIPVSKSTWWAGVASGRYPQPVRLSAGVTVWRAEDVYALLAKQA
jgi:prophage regulatory protein